MITKSVLLFKREQCRLRIFSPKKRQMKGLVICLLVLSVLTGCKNQQDRGSIKNNYKVIEPGATLDDIVEVAANITPSPRQLRWQELEFIAFFHFGINTFTGREWGDGSEDPRLFNPTEFDARQWVRVCKESGIEQVVLTAKHHDGFCLWPSQYTDHSVKQSPWKEGKGDVVKEVAEACREFDLGFGVYLSPWDRNSSVYGDSPKYNEYFMNQLTELLTNYGKVDEVWFDGACGEGPNGKRQVYDWEAYYGLIRELQPEAVIAVMGPDVRWVGTETGYGRETEWSVLPADMQDQELIASDSQTNMNFVPQGDFTKQDLGSRTAIADAKALIWYPAETDVSIRPGWFYHEKEDSLVKSPQKLMDIYFSSVGRNGVLLLNLPPDRRGLIHENDVKSLQGLKAGIDKLYGTNYISDASLKSDGENVEKIKDQDNSTHWISSANQENGVIQVTLPKPQLVDVLSLQENIRVGQRIEKFELEYWDGKEWKVATKGTTIGYKRLLHFDPVLASEFRIRILESRLQPTIAEVGLYKYPDMN